MSAKRCLRLEPLEDRRLLAGWVFGIGVTPDDVAVDAADNFYVSGTFRETVDFDPGPGATLLTSTGYTDGFVAKYSSDKTLLWARALDAPADGIAVDAAGNAYVTGFFWGTAQFGDTTLVSTLDPTQDPYPSDDIFVSKLNADGEFQWTVRYGGVWDDKAADIAIDSAGDVYLTGSFEATVQFGNTFLTDEGGGSDIFIAKLDGTDGRALWAQRAGAALRYLTDTGSAIAVSQGDVYVAGELTGTAQFGGTLLTGSGGLVTKLDAASGSFLWAEKMGGTARDVTLDSNGNLLMTGPFVGTTEFGPYQMTSVGMVDGFVAKINSEGSFLWALSVGGTSMESIIGVAVDADANLHLTGYFKGTADVDPGPESTYLTSAGHYDSFVLKLDPEGHYLDSWQWGGPDGDQAYAIATDAAGNAYVTGLVNTPVTFPNGTLTGASGFVMKLGDAVIPQADAYNVDEDQTLNVPLPGVLDNDTHSAGQTLTATLADGPSHGTLSLNGGGSFTYEPNPDFNGIDSFTYLAGDGDIHSTEATVTITVTPVNDTPQAINDTYTTDVNVPLSPPASGVLENDTDVEDDSLTAVEVIGPGHAVVFLLNGDGSFVYMPEHDYRGADSFTYKVNDGQADSDVATVTITVGNPRHPGDADLSGWTDLSDFNIWNANKFMQGTAWARGDFNGDEITDLSDFNIWNAYKFTSAAAPTPLNDVVLAEAAAETLLGQAGLLSDLAWLDGTELDAKDRPNHAAAAVDKLLATYWP